MTGQDGLDDETAVNFVMEAMQQGWITVPQPDALGLMPEGQARLDDLMRQAGVEGWDPSFVEGSLPGIRLRALEPEDGEGD